MDMQEWYLTLQRPWFAPEPWVFGTAWGIIYPLIFVAFSWLGYLLYTDRLSPVILWPIGLNLVFNLSFTWIQFGLQNNILAAIWITVTVGTLIWLLLIVWPVDKISVILLTPYLVWGLFAMVLQYSITYLNW